MGGGHSHAPTTGGRERHRDRAGRRESRFDTVVLLLILLPILAATVVGGALLWPHGTPPLANAVQSSDDYTTVDAVVLTTRSESCPGTSEDRLPDGDIPKTVTCAYAKVRIDSGKDAGQRVEIAVPPPDFRTGIEPGTKLQLALYPPLDDDATDPGTATPADSVGTVSDGDIYVWQDYSRGSPLTLLGISFAVLVVLVARLRGLAALVGLGLAAVAIDRFMLPALRFGESPVAVALVCSIALMTVLLYLAHGVSNRTTTALLGTVFGLAVSAGLGQWATTAAHLTGLGSEQNYTLSTLTSQTDLSGVVLCGIIIASLGVLNDVTVTQASAVWEIHAHSSRPTWRGLFTSGMRVGRDHLASSVYTIVFAYAGAALPTLLLIDIYQRPLGQVLTSGDIAEELARTFVGAIGLILAIPLTTAIAVTLAIRGSAQGGSAQDRSAQNGSALDGSALDGSALDGSALDGSGQGEARLVQDGRDVSQQA